jgi:hypothetical protein
VKEGGDKFRNNIGRALTLYASWEHGSFGSIRIIVFSSEPLQTFSLLSRPLKRNSIPGSYQRLRGLLP